MFTMMRHTHTTRFTVRRPSGVALLVAVLVLVVLSSLLAGLATRMTMVKRRQAYRVEYQRARYALDSAIKYALAAIPTQDFALAPRTDMPDFSDLFVMDGEQYRAFIEAWLWEAEEEQIKKVLKKGASRSTPSQLSSMDMYSAMAGLFGGSSDDPNAPMVQTEPNMQQAWTEPNMRQTWTDLQDNMLTIDPNDVQVPGPYGPPWPYVTEPIEFQIGPAQVTIQIEDENAKMPLSWVITDQDATNKQAAAALSLFCDWMGLGIDDREALQNQLSGIYEHKVFELNPAPVLLPVQPAQRQQEAASEGQTRQVGRFTVTRTTAAQRQQMRQQTRQAARTTAQLQTQQRPTVAHAADFAKLFHSSLLDREALAHPVPHTALPDESPLKYLGLWGSQRVNVNTAPRHVLEAALSFGSGDPTVLVENIIQKRREAPIKTLEELKDAFYIDSQTIERAKDYLTTTSNFFLIRVVSRSGNARVSAVATVIKEGRNVERLVILYGL